MKYNHFNFTLGRDESFTRSEKNATSISPDIAVVFGNISGLSIWKGLLTLKVRQIMVLYIFKIYFS